jgi:hypothetical protein
VPATRRAMEASRRFFPDSLRMHPESRMARAKRPGGVPWLVIVPMPLGRRQISLGHWLDHRRRASSQP